MQNLQPSAIIRYLQMLTSMILISNKENFWKLIKLSRYDKILWHKMDGNKDVVKLMRALYTV